MSGKTEKRKVFGPFGCARGGAAIARGLWVPWGKLCFYTDWRYPQSRVEYRLRAGQGE